MDKVLSSALSRMHSRLLKPLGFRKAAATFRRDHETHTELYNVQSSAWNGPEGSSFYLNCGLTFAGVPLQYTGEYFAGTQWAGRIASVVPGAPSAWNYSADTVDVALEEVAHQILRASEEMAANLCHYKQAYLERVERLNGIKARAKA